MVSLSDNLVRASMTSVDIWRGVEDLEKRGLERAGDRRRAQSPGAHHQAPEAARTHPSADAGRDGTGQHAVGGPAPHDRRGEPRGTGAGLEEEQAKEGSRGLLARIAHALSKRRIPFSAAKFDDDLARAYGVVWEDDLFVPAGEDGRYTTNVEGFFGAQQEWLANNLPERGSLLTQDEYGHPVLPKKAERSTASRARPT